MSDHRLGDVIDDHCIKCRRVTNHAIVSIVALEPAKVRCRSCYHDHDYRHEQAPPTKKELKQQELFRQVLASLGPAEAAAASAEAGVGSEPKRPAKAPAAKAKRAKDS